MIYNFYLAKNDGKKRFFLSGIHRRLSFSLQGAKNLDLAMELLLAGKSRIIAINVLKYEKTKQDFLSFLEEGWIILFLPGKREGFYIPSKEGMYAGMQ